MNEQFLQNFDEIASDQSDSEGIRTVHQRMLGKQQHSLHTTTTIFSCIYGCLALILMRVTLKTLIADALQLEIISDNWNQSPLVDITVVNGTCPQGYENIMKGFFVGTQEGCDCRGITSEYVPLGKRDSLNIYSCGNDERKAGCRDISKIGPFEINKINNIRICAKRSGPNFLEINSNSHSCRDNSKLCESGVSCIPFHQECPITDIQMISVESETPSEYTALPFNSSHQLIFTRQSNHPPFIDFKFEEGQPCSDPTETPSSGEATWHILDRKYGCTVEIAGNVANQRYHKLFPVTSSFELYSNNGLLQILRELPEYDVNKFRNYQRSLYWSTWIPWDLECESELGYFNFRQTAVEHIKILNTFVSDLNSYCDLIWYGYYAVAGLCFVILVSKNPGNRILWNKVRQGLVLIFGIVQIIAVTGFLWRSQLLRVSIEYFAGVKCSDDLGNYSFWHTISTLKYNQAAHILAVLVLLFTLVVEVSSFLRDRSIYKLKQE